MTDEALRKKALGIIKNHTIPLGISDNMGVKSRHPVSEEHVRQQATRGLHGATVKRMGNNRCTFEFAGVDLDDNATTFVLSLNDTHTRLSVSSLGDQK